FTTHCRKNVETISTRRRQYLGDLRSHAYSWIRHEIAGRQLWCLGNLSLSSPNRNGHYSECKRAEVASSYNCISIVMLVAIAIESNHGYLDEILCYQGTSAG